MKKNKHIKEAVDYFFRNFELEKERKIKAYSYCKGINGPKDYGTNMKYTCNNNECTNCRNMDKLIREELKRQIESYEKSNL